MRPAATHDEGEPASAARRKRQPEPQTPPAQIASLRPPTSATIPRTRCSGFRQARSLSFLLSPQLAQFIEHLLKFLHLFGGGRFGFKEGRHQGHAVAVKHALHQCPHERSKRRPWLLASAVHKCLSDGPLFLSDHSLAFEPLQQGQDRTVSHRTKGGQALPNLSRGGGAMPVQAGEDISLGGG